MEINILMLKRIAFILFASAMFLAACGSAQPAAPTIDPAGIPLTAAAAAETIVALTSAAQPPTPLPPPTEAPSPIPLPTFTPDPLFFPPTDALPTFPPTPTQGSSSTNCAGPLDMGAAGPTKKIRIENTTTGRATVSLNLWTPNLFGQCGSLSYIVNKGEKVKIDIPNGSWYAYAWIDYGGTKSSTAEGSFYLGPSKTDDLLRLLIKKDVFGLIGP